MFSGIKSWVITSLVLLVLKFQIVFSTDPHVPCFFIFGDSSVDSGNNNNLDTPSKANYLPYGIDFINGPTGRFTNGRNRVDFISQFLGFNDFIPSFATARGNNILRGVNYGSGAGGILTETGQPLGVIGFDEQLRNHLTTVLRINFLQGNFLFTNNYLKKCLYAVSIGGNDYIGNYLFPNTTSNILFTPQTFAARLIRAYDRQMRTLYTLGARKLAIFSIGPIGCFPQQIFFFGTNGSACVDRTNNVVRIFDDQLKLLVQRLNRELRDAKFTFINSTSVISQNRTAAGITVENLPCCPVSIETGGLCIQNSIPCSNRSEYAFYDLFHTTEIVNKGIAERSYIAQSPFDAHPVDISHLVDL